mmetsp:Transcript_8020/g.22379  ORF Transcript_8020/g.22379 Transcript_8020/m.22379 type:complete len:219 (-) Transcript_8020:6234-6890(-)
MLRAATTFTLLLRLSMIRISAPRNVVADDDDDDGPSPSTPLLERDIIEKALPPPPTPLFLFFTSPAANSASLIRSLQALPKDASESRELDNEEMYWRHSVTVASQYSSSSSASSFRPSTRSERTTRRRMADTRVPSRTASLQEGPCVRDNSNSTALYASMPDCSCGPRSERYLFLALNDTALMSRTTCADNNLAISICSSFGRLWRRHFRPVTASAAI